MSLLNSRSSESDLKRPSYKERNANRGLSLGVALRVSFFEKDRNSLSSGDHLCRRVGRGIAAVSLARRERRERERERERDGALVASGRRRGETCLSKRQAATRASSTAETSARARTATLSAALATSAGTASASASPLSATSGPYFFQKRPETNSKSLSLALFLLLFASPFSSRARASREAVLFVRRWRWSRGCATRAKKAYPSTWTWMYSSHRTVPDSVSTTSIRLRILRLAFESVS